MQWNNIQSLNENYRTDYTFQWIYVINIANGPSNTHSPLLFTHCWYVAGQTLYFEPSLSYKCGNATNFSNELRLFEKWVRIDQVKKAWSWKVWYLKSMQWNNVQSLNENYRTDYTFQWI